METRRAGVASALLCLLIPTALGLVSWLSWSPSLLRWQIGAIGAAGLMSVFLWTRTRQALAPLAAAATTLVTALATTGAWLLPSPSRAAWCDRPGSYCADGMLVVGLPVVGIVAAMIAAGVTWAITAVIHVRARSSRR